jgi:hypothetical protein
MVISPLELGTKRYSAGEYQQQLSSSQSKRRSQNAEGKMMRVETAYFVKDYAFTILVIKWVS